MLPIEKKEASPMDGSDSMMSVDAGEAAVDSQTSSNTSTSIVNFQRVSSSNSNSDVKKSAGAVTPISYGEAVEVENEGFLSARVTMGSGTESEEKV